MKDAGANAKMTSCSDCAGKVSRRAESCPHCGAPLGRNERDAGDCLLTTPDLSDALLQEDGADTAADAAKGEDQLAESKRRVSIAVGVGVVGVVAVVLTLAWPDEVVTGTDLPTPTVAASTTPPPPSKPAADPRRRAFIGRVSKMLANSAEGRTTTTSLATTFAAQQFEGFHPESTKPALKVLKFGAIDFKGRKLPAGIVEAKFTMVNRAAGEKRTLCIAHASAFDAEFDMWRELRSGSCDQDTRRQLMDQWQQETGFNGQ